MAPMAAHSPTKDASSNRMSVQESLRKKMILDGFPLLRVAELPRSPYENLKNSQSIEPRRLPKCYVLHQRFRSSSEGERPPPLSSFIVQSHLSNSKDREYPSPLSTTSSNLGNKDFESYSIPADGVTRRYMSTSENSGVSREQSFLSCDRWAENSA